MTHSLFDFLDYKPSLTHPSALQTITHSPLWQNPWGSFVKGMNMTVKFGAMMALPSEAQPTARLFIDLTSAMVEKLPETAQYTLSNLLANDSLHRKQDASRQPE